MERINIEYNFKDKVLDVWGKYKNIDVLNEFGKEYRMSPLLPKYVKKNAILFIGINPSFTKKNTILQEEKKIGFYPTVDKNTTDIPYFEKFKEVSNYCHKSEWTHLDLFFLRETNQKVIEKLSYANIDFLEDQLKITFEIIEMSVPKIIVVANAFASEFFGKMKAKHYKHKKIWQGYDLDFKENFNEDIGAYKITLGKIETPIIFSGMLSGQRALDIGSLERLKWQIKMILNKSI